MIPKGKILQQPNLHPQTKKMEQSNGWNCPLHTNFINFSKAFDSVHRPALWKILAHYGIPNKILSIIKMLYTEFQAKVICGTNLTDNFSIQTGVKHGCMLSPILFNFCIDWLMKRTTENDKRGIPWTFYDTLEDLDVADDIGLLSKRYQDIQGKTEDLASFDIQIGFNINTSKTKLMKINTNKRRAIKLNNSEIEETDEFVYLGSKIKTDGDSTSDINNRISKARSTFASLRNI
jgi:hypothetical protein